MSDEKGIGAGLLLPGQYVDLVRRNDVIEGELKLLLAVLEDAIRCYLRNVNAKDGERRGDFVEVRKWFEAGSGAAAARRADIFSFENLCAALGIEPRCLLARLRILTITDLPSRRYQMRRQRPLSSLQHANGARQRGGGEYGSKFLPGTSWLAEREKYDASTMPVSDRPESRQE